MIPDTPKTDSQTAPRAIFEKGLAWSNTFAGKESKKG
jgi:hypothetical protein